MKKISFYFDEMMPNAVAKGLAERGYQVVMAVHVGMEKKDDLLEHLPYARQNEMVIVTCDHPFAGRVAKMSNHAGVTGAPDDIGGMISNLQRFCENHDANSMAGMVFWIK